MSKISVVIPTYWQADLCVVHVRECMNSSRPPDEIIVVNDCGDPTLLDKLKQLTLTVPVIYAFIREDIVWNYNGACNLGVWLSSGDLISIEDADHVPWRNAYKDAEIALQNKVYDRVHFSRRWVPIKDTQEKPFEQWEPYGKLGPNQMVTIIRRELYLRLKGQDERFCGRYGYMAYDWASRYRKLNISSVKCDGFFIIKDGSENNMQRSMSKVNREFYKHNARAPWHHSTHGMLNFTYDFQRLS